MIKQVNILYILPSQVQCNRFKAPSALFQCCRWKKAYATASLSPLFKMCSGGRIRLFISNKYYRWENKKKKTCSEFVLCGASSSQQYCTNINHASLACESKLHCASVELDTQT